MNLKFHTESVHSTYDQWLKDQLAKGFTLERVKEIIDKAIDKNRKSKSPDTVKLTIEREILSLKSAAIDRAKLRLQPITQNIKR